MHTAAHTPALCKRFYASLHAHENSTSMPYSCVSTLLCTTLSCSDSGPAQYVCGQIVQMVLGMYVVAGAMALFSFESPYSYPQFTIVAYVLACGGVMILFVAATELLVRVLRTFEINPNDHAEALSAGVSLSFSAGLVGGSLFGGALVQALEFRGACRVLFYVMVSLPVLTVIPFHPIFMHGKKLVKSSRSGSKGKKEGARSEGDDEHA